MTDTACEKSEELTAEERLASSFLLLNKVTAIMAAEVAAILNGDESIKRASKHADELLGGIKKGLKVPKKRGRKPKYTPEQLAEINAIRYELFDKFWEKYPRKEGEVGARKWWLRISGLELIFPQIMAALEWQIKQWEGGKYAPTPVKYILDKRWNDAPLSGKKRTDSVFGDLNFPQN